jgi:hypothetical protein
MYPKREIKMHIFKNQGKIQTFKLNTENILFLWWDISIINTQNSKNVINNVALISDR